MKALTYLLIFQIKNKVLSLKKKPAFLILYGFIFVMIAMSIVTFTISQKDITQTNFSDERIIFLILAGLALLFLYLFTNNGLSNGSSLFTMPDVGLLFVSPISSKKILMYGLLSSLGKALLGSIFIFYQIGNLKANFGYGLKEIFGLFFIVAILILFGQLLAIGIYIFSQGNTLRKSIIKTILFAIYGVILLAALLIQRQEQVGILEAAFRVVDSTWFGYVPVAGWVTMFFVGLVHSSLLSIVLSIVLFLVTGTFILFLLTAGKADYYEDVIVSTEYTFQTRQAVKEGRNISSKRNKQIQIKDKDQGIGYGSGARTLMYKHILELKRKSRFIFIDNYTIVMMIALGITGYYFNLKEVPKEVNYMVLAMMIYIQYIFAAIMGKLNVELMKPYIYLIPEKSRKKVFAASATSLLKPCIDGILIFMVFAFFHGANLLTCIFFAFAYAASGTVFVGMTILYQRVLGGQPNKLIQMLVGLSLLFVVMTPGVVASVIAAYLLPEAFQFLSMVPYTAFCILFTTLLFALNGNLIDKAEYTGK